MSALLAKSATRSGQTLSLLQHLRDTREAVDAVFPNGSRWQHAWLRFFKIGEQEAESFWRSLRIAALLHDIGKANEDFQRAVTAGGAQSIRHEHLSALLLCLPSWREWLSDGGVDADLVTAAVLSHHVKAAQTGDYRWCQPRTSELVDLYLQHSDVGSVLNQIAAELGVKTVPPVPIGPWKIAPPWCDALVDGFGHAKRLGRDIKKDPHRRRFLAALKAGLIVADSVASAMFRENKSMQQWLSHNAHLPALSPHAIENAITGPRAKQIAERRKQAFTLHAFQGLAGEEGPRVILTAPCGAGKTLAAWEWAKNQARGREFARVIFLYPTRGTATEGFRDYVGWAPEGEGTLLHGSSEFELASIAQNPPESLANKDVEQSEAEARMFALGLWRFAYFSATVDQFLSFMQNRYRSLCLLPALADSILILDEIHSYDATMFELLGRFLQEFDVPVLGMTATLPRDRADALVSFGMTPFPRAEHASRLSDLEQTATHPRYRIRFEPLGENALREAIEAYRAGRRVLVVVNRVARCVEAARAIEEALGELPLVYHSRFRLRDRQCRHAEVVAAFSGAECAIAVTTQVCEMSLDLDAQVLVTELAPVPSLIQRLGRANRHLQDKASPAEVIVCEPAKAAPYQAEELNRARDFVHSVLGTISQQMLAERLAQMPREHVPTDAAGEFLSGGYFAVPGSFRDEDHGTAQCICDTDLEAVLGALREHESIDGFVLPAPRKCTSSAPSGLPRYLALVDGSTYSPLLGLEG